MRWPRCAGGRWGPVEVPINNAGIAGAARTAEVAERSGVSTTPGREAFRWWEKERLVNQDPHRGVVVFVPSVADRRGAASVYLSLGSAEAMREHLQYTASFGITTVEQMLMAAASGPKVEVALTPAEQGSAQARHGTICDWN